MLLARKSTVLGADALHFEYRKLGMVPDIHLVKYVDEDIPY